MLSRVYMDYMGHWNLGPTLGSDPESLDLKNFWGRPEGGNTLQVAKFEHHLGAGTRSLENVCRLRM